MNKATVCLVFLVVVFAFAEANVRQCRRVCHKGQPSMIRCVMDTHGCRKMRTCSIEEENCRRRLINQKPLKTTHSYHCRYIKGALGSGHCAHKKSMRMRRNVRPNCQHKHCNNPSKKLNCYRTNNNNQCQLLTACQLHQVNCHRGRNNALTWVDSRHCNGMKSGQPLQQCRNIPHRG